MRRILYIAIAILGLAGVTTAAVVSSNTSSDDCPAGGCPFKSGKKAGMVRMMNKSAMAAPEADGGGSSCSKSRCSK